ncbi:hypothetical protein AMELA_G00141150 [Ameiurus melas]|uniref:Neuroblast differentiation-associated protein AHNAK n=1 Tax=Ameiurus melas TaxID=219545 RepID=A0A7J6API4_AMEME|nr:hypothetical protein AMELA_G00141150 [Ameiurus melas]
MTNHRRSLSESITFEDNDKRYVHVSGINHEKYQDGDETVGAMKNEMIDILQPTEPYNDKIQVLLKPHMRSSKSLENLDNRIKAPDELRTDTYNRLFNTKVKRFIKGNPQGKSQDVRPNIDVKGDFTEPEIGLSSPNMDAGYSRSGVYINGLTNDVNPETGRPTPNVDLSGKINTPRFKMPDFGPSAHKIRAPDIDLSHPKIKGELDSRDITTPDLNVHTLDRSNVPNLQKPHLNFEVPYDDIDVSGFSNDIKAPSGKLKMPKFGLSGHLPKGGADEQDIKLALPEADLKAPKLNVNSPDIDIDNHTGKLKMHKFNLPSYEGPDTDVKGDLERPNLHWSSPKFDADVDVPDIDGPKADMTLPNMDLPSGKSKMPKFNMPDFGHSKSSVKTPEMDLSLPKMKGQINSPNLTAPEFDTDVPTGKIKGPTIKEPKLGVKSPEFNFDAPSGKIKMPHFKSPTFKGDMSSPDMNLAFPDADVNGPKLNVNSPDIGIDGSTGKIKMPKMKTPKFSLPGFKGRDTDVTGDLERPDLSWSSPKFDADVDVPDIDIDGPKADFKDMTLPNMDLPSGKSKMPKFKMPDFGHSKSSVKTPEMDLSLPKMKGQINSPNLTAPELDIDVPKDVSGPKFDIDGPKANVNGVTLPDMHVPSGKTRKSKFRLPGFGLSGPKIKAPEVDHSLPKMKGEINSPNLSVPELDVNVPTGKIKGPTLKEPKVDIGSPDININAPSGKLKMPNIKGPTFKGDMGSPDMNLAFPDANLKGPKLDVNSPDIDIDGPTGKIKMPKMKTPKFSIPGFKGPDTDVKGGLKGPDLSMSSPKFDADVSGPNFDIDGPKANVNGVTLPDMHVPSGKIKKPKFRLPDFGLSGPKIKTPDVDLSLPKMKGEINSPNLSVPELDVNVPTGKIKGPTLKEPKVDIRSPDFNINAPSGKLKMPNLKGPNIKGDINSPDMNLAFPEGDVKGPNLYMNSPDIDIDGPTGKIKMPKMKTPKFSFAGFKGPDTDVKGGLKGPDLSMSSPKFDADITGPDINGPKANVNGVTLPDMHVPSGKTKKPKFRLSDFGLSGPKIKTPDVELSLPKMKGEINSPNLSVPELDVNVPTGKIKGPTLKEPKVDIRSPDFNINAPSGKLKMPNLKGPNIKGDINSPDMNLAFPEGDVKGPNLYMNSPDIDIDGPTGKIKMPKVNTPKFSLPSFKGHETDIQGDLEGPDLSLTSKKLNAVSAAPDIDIDARKPTFPDMDLKMPGLKMPKLRSSDPKLMAPEMDASLPQIKGDNSADPATSFSIPGFKESDVDYKGTWERPDLSLSSLKPDYIHSPDIGIRGPKTSSIYMDVPEADFRAPKLDMKYPEIGTDGPESKFKLPKLTTPKYDVQGFNNPDIKAKHNLEVLYSNVSTLDSEFGIPDYVMHGPTTPLKGLKTELTLPDVDLPSGKVNLPDSVPNNHYKSDTKYHQGRDASHGSIKIKKDLESLVSGMELEVPKQSLKGSVFKKRTLL